MENSGGIVFIKRGDMFMKNFNLSLSCLTGMSDLQPAEKNNHSSQPVWICPQVSSQWEKLPLWPDAQNTSFDAQRYSKACIADRFVLSFRWCKRQLSKKIILGSLLGATQREALNKTVEAKLINVFSKLTPLSEVLHQIFPSRILSFFHTGRSLS